MKSKHIAITALLATAAAVVPGHTSAQVEGRTIVSFSPVQLSEYTPTGVGLQVERFTGGTGKWSAYLPFSYSFGHMSACDPSMRAHVFYAAPGVKFYPWGSKHAVSYAIGASVAVGMGETNYRYDESMRFTTETITPLYRQVEEVGVLLNNSVNVMAGKHMCVGSDVQIGQTVINKYNGAHIDQGAMFQINFKVGYRF